MIVDGWIDPPQACSKPTTHQNSRVWFGLVVTHSQPADPTIAVRAGRTLCVRSVGDTNNDKVVVVVVVEVVDVVERTSRSSRLCNRK